MGTPLRKVIVAIIAAFLLTISTSKISASDTSMEKNKDVKQEIQVQGQVPVEGRVFMVRVPPPTPASAPEVASKSEVVQYIYSKFGTGWQGKVAQCIAFHESGDTAEATHFNRNGSVDRGIFQINSIHGYPASVLFDWRKNVDIAYKMSGAGNSWGAWATESECI